MRRRSALTRERRGRCTRAPIRRRGGADFRAPAPTRRRHGATARQPRPHPERTDGSVTSSRAMSPNDASDAVCTRPNSRCAPASSASACTRRRQCVRPAAASSRARGNAARRRQLAHKRSRRRAQTRTRSSSRLARNSAKCRAGSTSSSSSSCACASALLGALSTLASARHNGQNAPGRRHGRRHFAQIHAPERSRCCGHERGKRAGGRFRTSRRRTHRCWRRPRQTSSATFCDSIRDLQRND